MEEQLSSQSRKEEEGQRRRRKTSKRRLAYQKRWVKKNKDKINEYKRKYYDPVKRKAKYEASKRLLTEDEKVNYGQLAHIKSRETARTNPYNTYERTIEAAKEVVMEEYNFDYKTDIAERSKRMNMTKFDKAKRIEDILDWMKSGMSSVSLVKKISKEFQVSTQTAKKWKGYAEECLDSYIAKDVEVVRRQQIVRLENLLEKALENNDYKGANQIIETMNKTAGVYNAKSDNTNILPVISFKFGGDDAKQIITTASVQLGEEYAEAATSIVSDAEMNGLI